MGKSFLITGPAGSGKTEHCLRVCRNALKENPPGAVLYLVPGADAVRDTERRLLQAGQLRGIVGPVIVDFVGLATRIVKEAGRFPVHRLGVLERRFLILRVVREARLKFFENVRDYDGFADLVGEFMAELKRGMISPESFLDGCRDAVSRGNLLREKVEELFSIYRSYQEALKKRDAYDGDGVQWMAAELLDRTPSLLSYLKVLLVDGFATYTPVEFKILTLLVERAVESHVTLCYERSRPEVFDFVEESYEKLRSLCADNEVVLERRLQTSAGLSHLQKSLFEEPENPPAAGQDISILPCRDACSEMETVVREIQRIRDEEKLEYGDFLVILRSAGDYSRIISEVFSDRRIPYALSPSASLSENPFVRTVLSALHLVKGPFRHDLALALLKNSYAATDSDTADAIQNYVEEFGLSDEEEFRQTWTKPGTGTLDVNRLNEHKDGFLRTLDTLRSRAQGISTASDFRDFVFETIREFGLLHRACQRAEPDRAAGERGGEPVPPFAAEFASLSAVTSLLDSMCEYSRLVDLPQADFTALLDMFERGLLVSSLAPSVRNAGCVRVTSIVGGPPAPAKVVFVCGLCEGSFPKEIANEPFLKDRERRQINRRGRILLGERFPLSSGERFFFYFAVTRATERLLLTYPLTDSSGREVVPSHYVDEVARCFSDLGGGTDREGSALELVPPLNRAADMADLRCLVANGLSQRAVAQASRLHSFEGGAAEWDEAQSIAALAYNHLTDIRVLSAGDLIYQPPGPTTALPPRICGFFKRDPYFTSVSELETFAGCPFRRFCEYNLRLAEPPRYEFGPREEGTLYHGVLFRLYRQIYGMQAGRLRYGLSGDEVDVVAKSKDARVTGIEAIPEEELSQRLGYLVAEFINENYPRLFRTPRMEVRRRALETRLWNFILKEVENQRANATRPAYFELSFGRGASKPGADSRSTGKPLAVDSEHGPLILISGRMDRVDVFEENEGRYGILLDYKRNWRGKRADLLRGTVLQAGLYMRALRDLFGLRPAGAFYYSIHSGRKRGVFAREEAQRISGQGDVSRTDQASWEEIQELMRLNAAQAVGYVKRIIAGDIAVVPADSETCQSCAFSGACRVCDRVP